MIVTSVKKRGPKKKSHDKDASKEDEEPKQHRPDVSVRVSKVREICSVFCTETNS